MFQLIRSATVSLALVLVSACGSSLQGSGTDSSQVIKEIAERVGCTGIDVHEGLPGHFSGMCSTKPHGKVIIAAFANDGERDEYVQGIGKDGSLPMELIEMGTSWTVYDISPEDDEPTKDEPTNPKMDSGNADPNDTQLRDNTPDGWQRVTREEYTYAIPASWQISEKEGADTFATNNPSTDPVDSVIVTLWATSPDSLSNLKSRMVSELQQLGARDVAPYEGDVNPAGSEGAENSAITKYRMPTDGGLAHGYQALVHFRANKWIILTLTTMDENPDALFEKVINSLIFYP